MSTRNITAILNDGMECLLEKLGVIDTEIFISTINRENFDYTEWRKDKFNDMSAQELNHAAAEYGRLHHND